MYMARLARVSLVFIAASVACTDNSNFSSPSGVDDANSSTGALSPRSGAVVGDNAFLTVFGGAPGSNLALLVGTEGSAEDACAALALPSPQNGIAVETPSGKFPSHAVSQEAPVQVFAFPGFLTGFCGLVGAPLVATGTVFFNQTVNQFPGPGTGPGSFAIQVTVDGIVDLVAGGQARLHAGARVEIRPDGTLVKDQESITLTPL
jgi:hypothetical protein